MTRENLPQRRANETFEFEYPPEAPIRYMVTLGFLEDGRIGEVFVNGPKSGSGAAINAADSAVLLSIALQHGATVDALREAPIARDSTGRPLGPIGRLIDMLATGEGVP